MTGGDGGDLNVQLIPDDIKIDLSGNHKISTRHGRFESEDGENMQNLLLVKRGCG